MARYTDAQKIEALALLAVNNGNISKTSKDTNISRQILRAWQGSELNNLPEVTIIKNEIADERKHKLKLVANVILDRMLEVVPTETDLHKLAGALKIVQGVEVTNVVQVAITESVTSSSSVSSDGSETSAQVARGTAETSAATTN
jgi:transposase-like protein